MNRLINYIKNTSKVKAISLLLLLFVIIAVAIFSWNYFINQKEVTLIPSPNTSISVISQKGSRLIAKTNFQKKLRIDSGTYTIKYTGSKEYRGISESVLINRPRVIKTPTLYYTVDKLNQLLIPEKNLLHTALFSSITNIDYQINKEALFNLGDWYGAQLIPDGWYDPTVPADYIPRPVDINNTVDMVKIIMKKEGNKWKVMAGPSIVFYTGDYPNIPKNVIRATNKIGFK